MNDAIRSRQLNVSLANAWHGFVGQRGKAWGFMIVGALLAFELFNYSTTEFALNDVLGSLSFAGLKWATILAIAFCGIDFAGIARLFTPEQGAEEPAEVWYLFGAWILAAAMNATLTWWGVSVAIANHASQYESLCLGRQLSQPISRHLRHPAVPPVGTFDLGDVVKFVGIQMSPWFNVRTMGGCSDWRLLCVWTRHW